MKPIDVDKIMLLDSNWKRYAIAISALISLVFILLIMGLSRKFNFLHYILLDSEYNSYSLANFQAFIWTVVLMDSYFYIAVCQGLILGNIELPEFNFSLIALLGVSYGGMVAHNYIDKRKKDFIVPKDKPEWKDLIYDSKGTIDITRNGFNE